MTDQTEQPIRQRVCRCRVCGCLFTDISGDETNSDEEAALCPTCQALEDAPAAPLPGITVHEAVSVPDVKTVSTSANVSTSEDEVDKSNPQVVRNEPSPLGLPSKIAWTTPAFRAGWENADYSRRSSDTVPTRASIAGRRRRTLLALLGAVSALMLLSRLDVTSVEMVWNDWMKAKPADQKHVLPPEPQIENAKSPTAK